MSEDLWTLWYVHKQYARSGRGWGRGVLFLYLRKVQKGQPLPLACRSLFVEILAPEVTAMRTQTVSIIRLAQRQKGNFNPANIVTSTTKRS